MKTPEVYLAGEEHHQHSYIMAEIALIKRLVAEGAISALSLELEYYKYGEVEADINSVGRIAPIVSLARRNHLDILASDYRDTFIGHVIKELRKRDDRSNAPDSEKEVSFLSDLKPLVFSSSIITFMVVLTHRSVEARRWT